MLQSLFRRAEASVDHAVAGIIVKIAVAIPFLIALGFFTTAATIFVTERFDSGTAYLIMAAAFAIVGLIVMAIVNTPKGQPKVSSSHSEAASGDSVGEPGEQGIDTADREMLMTALAAIGPAAAPAVVRLVVRNLPLIAAIAAAGFVLSRSPGQGGGDEVGLEPAE